MNFKNMKKYILVAMIAFAFGAFCGVAFKNKSNAEDLQYYRVEREIIYNYQSILDNVVSDDMFFDVVAEMDEWIYIVDKLGNPYLQEDIWEDYELPAHFENINK